MIDQLHYLWKCYCKRKDDKFVNNIMNWEENTNLLEINHLGEENEGMIVFLIREQGSNWGFFAEFRAMLGKLYFAENLGMVPYVEWKENFLYYQKEGIRGEENAFLYYFEPVSNIQNVDKSKNLLYAEYKHSHYIEEVFNNKKYITTDRFINEMGKILGKYIKFNEFTRNYLNDECKPLDVKSKILGVHFRGTDFKRGYNDHPIKVNIQQVKEKVTEFINLHNYEKIFLATDDKDAAQNFMEEWGDRLIIFNDTYRGTDQSVAFSVSDRDDHKYLLGLEVIRDVYALSLCHGLICGYSQVGLAARLFKRSRNEVFENFYLIDNGINKNGKRMLEVE